MNTEDAAAARSLLDRLAQQSPPPPSWTHQLARRVTRRSRRGRAAVSLVAASVMALIVVVGVALSSGHNGGVNSITTRPVGQTPTAPKSIQVNGKAVPYAGTVPWANPVATSANPRDIDIFADGDSTHGEICNLPFERVSVVETASSVVVSVDGYQAPLPTGVGCAGTGHQPQLHQIRLRAPLGDRLLIDSSDGSTHRVLDESTIPKPYEIPAGLQTQPVQWDEKSGYVSRSYVHNSGNRLLLSVSLEYGTFSTCQCAVEHGAPNGKVVETIAIGGVPGQVWRYTGLDYDITTIQWTPTGKRTIRLTIGGPHAQQLPVDEAIAIARSVR